jgi:hypothetical protein
MPSVIFIIITTQVIPVNHYTTSRQGDEHVTSDWIELIADQRCGEILDQTMDGDNNEEYNKLHQLISSGCISDDVAFELENIFLLHTAHVIRKTYIIGVKEGIENI